MEAKLLNRNAVGIDINPQSISISEKNLQFQCETTSKIRIQQGNSTNLNFVKDYFLGDPEVIKKLMDEVANQGKSKK